MKYFLVVLLCFAVLSGYSQKDTTKPKVVHTVTMTLNEEQLVLFSQLLNIGMSSPAIVNSEVLTMSNYQKLSKFNDSLQKSWAAIYNKWYPKEVVKPKTDSADVKKSKTKP